MTHYLPWMISIPRALEDRLYAYINWEIRAQADHLRRDVEEVEEGDEPDVNAQVPDTRTSDANIMGDDHTEKDIDRSLEDQFLSRVNITQTTPVSQPEPIATGTRGPFFDSLRSTWGNNSLLLKRVTQF
jgi:hypothetical protein